MINQSRLITASFHDTVLANSNKTLVSNKIDLPFSTTRIRAAFAPGCDRLLRLSFYISPDKSAPTTEPPNGSNIFTQVGPTLHIVGDDNIVDFEHEIQVRTAGYYLKVYAENLDAFEHTIDAQITIRQYTWEELEEEPKEEK